MKEVLNCSVFAIGLLGATVVAVTAGAAERAQQLDPAGREREETRSIGKAAADYVLQPQDVLRIYIFQHDDLNKQMEAVQVSPEHTISIPLVQTINLRGKTTRQAEQIIRDAYDRDFLVNPQVSVIVAKYSERSVSVIGRVNKPDRVPFPQEKGLTILEAITGAGGPDRLADLRKVKLTRMKENGETESFEIDADALAKRGGKDPVQLQPNDVIFVPERIL